jgi:hypothetical protein
MLINMRDENAAWSPTAQRTQTHNQNPTDQVKNND